MVEPSDTDLEQRFWGYLRPLVVEKLPAEAVALIERIEAFAGIPVGFRDTALLRQAGGQCTEIEALFCDQEHAYVSIPDPDNIDPNAIVHELLHLHRYWVESVPQMGAVHDLGQNVEFMANIDNALEHLIIVPQERQYGYDPSPYWAKTVRDAFAAHPWPTQRPEWIRYACILGWATAALTDDRETREMVRAKIERSGLLEEAETSLKRIRAQSASKPRMVRAALKALRIPLRSVELVTFDVRNHMAHRRPVPSV